MFKDKVLLVTGGTGSFGNAVVRRFQDSDIAEIRIFSRDEKKQEDMRNELRNPKLKFYIGDVRNFNSINSAMRGVDYVFNAAALKQVPSCEFYPLEAIYTNILGTENTLSAAMARASIGVSASDAASISMLEAMIMGSFPIQSNTSCAHEWIHCGVSGCLVPPEDPHAIAEAIRRAVTDDELVDRAAEINAQTTAERRDQSVIRPQVIAMYEKVAAATRKRGKASQ